MTLRDEVEALASDLSKDSLLVQGAGGNISWKEDGFLWVSQSGARLDEVEMRDIFVRLELASLRKNFGTTGTGEKSGDLSLDGSRPSIETPLHALHPRRVVVHLHSVSALSFLVRENWREEIALRTPTNRSAVFVDYRRPGEPLAKEIHRLGLWENSFELIFLKNHGVVFASDTVSGVRDLVDEVVSALNLEAEALPIEAEHVAMTNANWLPPGNSQIHQLAVNQALFNRAVNDWAITPDHVVFLGPQAVTVAAEDEIPKAFRKNPAPFVFVEGRGVYATESANNAALEQLNCFLDVMVRQPDEVSLSTLSQQEVSELLDWEAEKFRQALAR